MKKFAAVLVTLLSIFYSSETISSNVIELTGITQLSMLTQDDPSITTSSLVLVSMWETELINKFRHEHSWMSVIPNKNNYVNNNVINLQEIGADPNVLIDNSTYPIATVGRTDNTLPVALHLYETENTKIRYTELTALPYDKEGSVIRQHRETLEEKTAQHGLHALSASSDATDTPIINTTGTDNGSSRKRCTSADIIRLRQKFDNLGVPKNGRVLVLCSDHVADLLIEDLSFRDRYMNVATGQIAQNYYGFQVFEDHYNPIFDASNVKKAFSAAAAGTDRNSSTAFYAPDTFKAMGDVKMFYSAATTDPENRETKVGFSLYNVVLPKKQRAIGALVSNAV